MTNQSAFYFLIGAPPLHLGTITGHVCHVHTTAPVKARILGSKTRRRFRVRSRACDGKKSSISQASLIYQRIDKGCPLENDLQRAKQLDVCQIVQVRSSQVQHLFCFAASTRKAFSVLHHSDVYVAQITRVRVHVPMQMVGNPNKGFPTRIHRTLLFSCHRSTSLGSHTGR